MIKDIIVFSLSSNIALTNQVCDLLNIKPGISEVKHFADGECIAFPRSDVRGRKVYIIQSKYILFNQLVNQLMIE